MKLIYIEPAEYFTPSARTILEEGETDVAKKIAKKSEKKQPKKSPKTKKE